MKKIISMFIMLILILTPLLQVSAYDILNEKKIAVKNILVTKSELKKISKWEQYISAMDSFVDKIKTNPEKIEKMKSKIDNAVYTLESKEWYWETLSKKELQLLKILKYLQARLIFLHLDNLQKTEEASDKKIEEILNATKNPNISETDKKTLEDAIINIQKNFLKQSRLSVENIMWDFENYFNYENKGDFEMNFNTDHESIWNIEAEFKLSDYVTQTSNFDSRFNGHASAMINALPKWEEAIKWEFNSFIDFILKDGQYYTLVKDLNIVTEENLEDFQDILDNLKTLAQENEYIIMPDTGSVEAMELLKSFHPDNFFHDAQETFSQSMFTAYKKEWNTYSIIPTKYACDSLKVLMNKFDPFSPNNCTDSQYRDIVEDFIIQWELTITLGNENILKYSQYSDDDIETFDIIITFTDSGIQEFILDLLPNQTEYKDEGFHVSYKKNKTLNFRLYAEQWDYDINFDSILDSRNNFSSITHTAYIQDWRDTYNWNLSLKNKKINWDFKIETKKEKYNYETSEYESIGSEYFTANINWNTNIKNELDNINIDYTGNDWEKNYLTWELIYDLPQLKIVNNYQDDYINSEFLFDGKWNKRNSNFDNFSASAEVLEKDRTYNYETSEYEYSQEEEKIFDMNYSLTDWNVNGTLNAYNDDKVIFWVITQGTYKKDQLELNNEINADFINSMFWYAEEAKKSKIISDLRTLAVAVEIHTTKYWTLPSTENFWEDIQQSKQGFNSPYWNQEIDWCKHWYIYAKSNKYYQFSSCIIWSDIKIKKWNYYEWADEELWEPVYLEWYTTWIQEEIKEKSTPVINFNFGYDYTSNKTNTDIYIDLMLDEEKVFEMNMKNTGTIEYKEIDIQAPSNTVPFEEVFETNSYYY